jgi:hypothetical protein
MRQRTVRRLIKGGQLKARRHGRSWLVQPEHLRRFQEQRESKMSPTRPPASSQLSSSPNQRQKDVQFWHKLFKGASLVGIVALLVCLVGLFLLGTTGRALANWFSTHRTTVLLTIVVTFLYLFEPLRDLIFQAFQGNLKHPGSFKKRISIFAGLAIAIVLIVIFQFLNIILQLRLNNPFPNSTTQTSSMSTTAAPGQFKRTSTPTLWSTSNSIDTSATGSAQPKVEGENGQPSAVEKTMTPIISPTSNTSSSPTRMVENNEGEPPDESLVTPTNTAASIAAGQSTSTPTNTATPVATNTAVPTVPTNTATSIAADQPTRTPTVTRTPTNTPTNTATSIAAGQPTRTPTVTHTPTIKPTYTATSVATDTTVPTVPTTTATSPATDRRTNTPSSTAVPTERPTNTPTATRTPTNTPTNTPTSVPSSTSTNTVVPTVTTQPSSTATSVPTGTPRSAPTDHPVTPTTTPCVGFAQGIFSARGVKNPEDSLCDPDRQHATLGAQEQSEIIVDMGASVTGGGLVDQPGGDLYFYEHPTAEGIDLDPIEIAVAQDDGTARPGSFKVIFVWGDEDPANNGTVPASYLPEDANRTIRAADLHRGWGIGVDIGENNGRSYRFVRVRAYPNPFVSDSEQRPQFDAVERASFTMPTFATSAPATPSITPSTIAQPSSTVTAISSTTPTPTASATPTPSTTATPTRRPTNTPSNRPTSTPAPTNTPAANNTPTTLPTDTPTSTPVPTDTPTSTPTDTLAPTDTPTSAPSPTEAPTSTPTDTPRPTDVPTHTPTALPTDTPSAGGSGRLVRSTNVFLFARGLVRSSSGAAQPHYIKKAPRE